MQKKCDVPELEVIADRFLNLKSRWSTVFGLLLKAYYSDNDKKLIKRMGYRINELAEEEIIYTYLINISTYNFSLNEKGNDTKDVMSDFKDGNFEFTYLDMGKLCK